MENNALVVVEKLDVAVVFSETGMTKLLEGIESKVNAYTLDITSEQGRKDIASLAYKVTRSKTLIDDLGKEVVADWKKKAKGIDGHRKIARDFLDNLKDKVRHPLNEWEVKEAVIKKESEAAEKVKIEGRIIALSELNHNVPFFDIAALSDFEYDILFAKVKEDYETEQKRLADEEAARIAEDARLKKVAADLQAQADAQAEKEKALQDEKERLDRNEFERLAREAADKQAKVDAEKAVEVERRRAENEKEAAVNKLKNFRYNVLEKIGFEYPFGDLGVMSEPQFDAIYDDKKEIYDEEQRKLAEEKAKAEMETKRIANIKALADSRRQMLDAVGYTYTSDDLGTITERAFTEMYELHRSAWEKEQEDIRLKAEAKEKARIESLKSDKEKIREYALKMDILLPNVAYEKAKAICINAQKRLAEVAIWTVERAEEL